MKLKHVCLSIPIPRLIAGFVLLMAMSAAAQQTGTSISSDGSAPNANAMLDIQSPSTNDGKGLLIPRVTYNQRTSANASLPGGLLNNSGNLRGGPAQGLLVYQINGTQGLYFNRSTSSSPSWTYLGDFRSNGAVPMTGQLNMNGRSITNIDHVAFSSDNISIGNAARAYSTLSGSVAIGAEATARYRRSGVAIGTEADGDYNGIAIGYMADGQYSNIAIGFKANAYSGYDRIAIGHTVTNRRNDTIAVRGTLYLDGGTGVLYRPNFGSGGWQAKAFTIDHPLDPENKMLRHFCVEGPVVWNIYAGRSILTNGEAEITLPDYYTPLNKVGSEVYNLTPIGRPADLYVKEEVDDNRFTVAGNIDVTFTWTIHVPRNDPACRVDLRQRPVEQLKSEPPPGRGPASFP